MPDYQKGKIYKIVNLASNDEHGGSTCNDLAKRFSGHKQDWKSGVRPSVNLFQAFREHGLDNFQIILVEHYPCNNRDELRAREDRTL